MAPRGTCSPRSTRPGAQRRAPAPSPPPAGAPPGARAPPPPPSATPPPPAPLHRAAADLQECLSAAQWYQRGGEQEGAAPAGRPAAIAYFSPEYGIAAALPQYSGGLGILAGDHLKAASDLGVPLIGVGLLYRNGY